MKKKQRWLNKFEYTEIHTMQKQKTVSEKEDGKWRQRKRKRQNYHHENLDDKIILMF